MQYDKIPLVLKRYSFDEKMRVLQSYSRQIMNINGISLDDNKPMAWELEIFLLFSIKADEYQYKNFKGKNINEFIKIINCIKEYQHPILLSKSDSSQFGDFLFIAYGSIQFDIQSYIFYKYYRYNYFFNYVDEVINMKFEFFKKFGIDYQLFLELGSILNYFCSLKVNINPKILEYIVLKYSKAVSLLIISRDNFKKEIDRFSNNIDDYLYCIRPSYIYPFVEYNKIVNLPLPHCMTRAITDSLLYRLTDDNLNLRTLFGKNVLENYLYEIIKKSYLFDETIKEKIYFKNKNKLKTSDVMCRIKNNYVFFESKSTVPYAKTRCLNYEYIMQELDKISDDVIQIYKQIYSDFKTVYNYFECDTEIMCNRNNCDGIVVLLEESYIRREIIYNDVAKKLEINTDDKLYKWIINHIKVCNLYDIEKYVFSGTSIIKSLKKQQNDKRPYDFSLTNLKIKSTIKNNDVYKFKINIGNYVKKITDELLKVGLLSK